ncbi:MULTISPECIES: TraB/GumN family protein [Paenibacillus]|uniref:Polysaccharide biosynthesis protein GumN n=1 Tax=Paenibacillus campinasensis TaxID=66347 RepID=A0A268EQR6_9BACL|nr:MULTISPECIES: TraB/GumN family protein [Paenibacillus]PAD75470.1 polysaccharide biosynthesis protein GumN [Paenibacillus campinasensis]PAK51456.1 polysaccharide biosynthesis protein GumN [Paenibacillus sp. 7541]
MKKWTRVLLSVMISAGLLATATPVMAGPAQPDIKVNDQQVEYAGGAPLIEKGTTYVPLRSTLQALDGQLTSAKDGIIQAVVNGQTITLKSSLKVINGVTYAPIRVVGDAAGYEVRWDASSRTVVLFSKEAAETGARGFLWQVEHDGNTVYLVGSMHVADDSFYPLRAEFEEAFAEADYLGVEIDLTKAEDEQQQRLMLEKGMYTDGTTLKDHISADTYAKLGEALEKFGLEPNALDIFKPWVAEVMISNLQMTVSGYDATAGIDLYFSQKAIERNIPILELESYESQLGMLSGFSLELQEKNLNTILEHFELLDQEIHQMAEMWKTGNEEQLLELTGSMEEEPEYHQAMLVDRNIEMAEKIDGYLKNGNNEEYFIVVGAAHYLGDYGIIKLLEDKGYTVVRK